VNAAKQKNNTGVRSGKYELTIMCLKYPSLVSTVSLVSGILAAVPIEMVLEGVITFG
jgi:hypothetical protein